VPSPLQNVVLDAEVPLLRFVTGRFPVTPVVSGKPVAFVNVTLVGVPKIGVTRVGLVDNTLLPEPVLLVTPVPPLATASVPATVTAPDVAVLGVRPVDPNEIVVTPADAAAPHVGTPPALTVRTWPVEPIPSFESVLVADEYRMSPVV